MKQICLRAKLAAVTEKYRGIELYSDIDAATDDYKVLLEVYGQSHSAQDLCL